MLIDARMTPRVFATQLALFVSLIFVAGCPDDPLTKVLSCIEVDPESIDFGEGIVDQDNVVPLTVRDCGEGNLELTSVSVMNEGGDVFSARDVPRFIGSFNSDQISVVFVPHLAHAMYRGTLIIASNDPARPEVRVPLQGIGGVREIDVVPLSIDFGTVNEGTAPRRAIEVHNIGKDPLAVSSVVFTSTSVDMRLAPGTFTEGVLLPGTSTVVEVVYSPVDRGADSGVVTIFSNDEDEPSVDVSVIGNANLAPIAIAWGCDKPLAPGTAGCDGMTKLHVMTAGFRRLVGIDGRDSHDPEGGAILEYRWRVEARPNDSRSGIFYSTDDTMLRKKATGDFLVDVVGSYDLRLIVKDERGLESLDREDSHVHILPRDLEILLRWDLATDVDLHVVRPGGTIGDYGSGRVNTSTGSDCSTFNRAPNWSDLSTSMDDPSLDKDDVTGRGPEIVSLDAPEDGGEYHAFAHYCDSHMSPLSTAVTIEVYVRGERVGSVPATGGFTLAPGEAWDGATVTWHRGDPPSVDIEEHTATMPVLMPELCLSE